MASWYDNHVSTTKALEQKLRERGYDDGFAGRPARSLDLTYAQAWRRGQEARRDLLLNDLDDDS